MNNKNKLLTREKFKEQVFEKTNGLCLFCKAEAVDAHHIMERRLFNDSGYYLDNGVAVCEPCHIKCEQTLFDTNYIRELAGIKNIILPDHFYKDEHYDKWGNVILKNGKRVKGELFYDESVQKILNSKNLLDLFDDKVKYPRTPHLPFSPGASNDDRILKNFDHFKNKKIVITEKLDGENTTMYKNYIHARSLDSKSHSSQSYVRNFHANIQADIPDNFRICGENVYAKHSIYYDNLIDYFYGFSIWDGEICLDYKQTLEYFELLKITGVPVLYTGIFDIKTIDKLIKKIDFSTSEGFVVRLYDSFHIKDFNYSVAKFVRENHVTSQTHWKNTKIVPNKIKI